MCLVSENDSHPCVIHTLVPLFISKQLRIHTKEVMFYALCTSRDNVFRSSSLQIPKSRGECLDSLSLKSGVVRCGDVLCSSGELEVRMHVVIVCMSVDVSCGK